jgi:hypothetical protein
MKIYTSCNPQNDAYDTKHFSNVFEYIMKSINYLKGMVVANENLHMLSNTQNDAHDPKHFSNVFEYILKSMQKTRSPKDIVMLSLNH